MVSSARLDNDDDGVGVDDDVDNDELVEEDNWDGVEDVELPQTNPTAEAMDRTGRLCEFTSRGAFGYRGCKQP